MNASVNLKDKLDGKELDLSLDNLSVVPVKEMAALTQATHVDLSCNLLTSLPDGFCQLTHLVKLDLSKNKLVQLPKNFGNLRKLQRLDLLGNKLVTLPVSIGSLKSLTWLDLKGNQLDERLSSVAGNCLNEAECKACAKKMVVFMKEIQSEKEKKLQKKLEEERAAEALRKLDLDKVRDLRKKQKASEKENRRKEWKLKEKTKVKEFSEKDTNNHKNGTAQDIKHKECLKKNGLSRCGACISFLVLLLAVALGLFLAFNPHLIELGRQKWQNYFRMS